MAWTQADVDALKGAIASGASKVQYQNGAVEYQSTGDMLKALDRMQLEVSGSAPAPRTVGVYASGLQGSTLFPGGTWWRR